MRYHIQENALFSAQNVTPAIQDTLQHMVQGDEAVLDWGFYTIGSPITITNATRLQYCTLTLHGEYTYTSSPAALQISADYFTFRMDRLTSHIASDVYDTPRPGGVVISESNYSTYEFGEIQGMDYGIRLMPVSTNTGLCYNKIAFRQIAYCYIPLHFSMPDNVTAWINENQITGGRLKGYYGLVFHKGSAQIDEYNNNSFYNLSFESIEEDAINSQFSSFNTFYSPRFESVNRKAIVEATTCKNNKYILSVAVPIDKVDIQSRYTVVDAPLHNAYWENEFRTMVTDYEGQASYTYYREAYTEAFNTYVTLPNNCRTVAVKSNTAAVTLEIRPQSTYENNAFYLYVLAYAKPIVIKRDAQTIAVPAGIITTGSYRVFYAGGKWKAMRLSETAVYSE